jgi:hypothetical protein
MLSSVADVIDAVGGASAACELTGIKSGNAPYNWKARGRIPSEHFLVFVNALRLLGKKPDPAVFGLTLPAVKRRP